MNGIRSDYAWEKEVKIKDLSRQLEAFKSGEKYVRMEAEHKRTVNGFLREAKLLEKKVSDAHAETQRVLNIWTEMYYDECEKTKKLTGEVLQLKERLKAARLENENLLDELAEEQEKNKKLTAMLGKDSENSSIPSSKDKPGKKVHNTREKTGRQKGAQYGHKRHPRRWQTPTSHEYIEPEERFLDESKYRPSGQMLKKQKVSISMSLNVTEYETPEYIEKATGKRVHSAFPDGVTNDVNYDGSIKAFLFLLNNRCNVSILKCSDMLSAMTDGKLKISAGMISKLNRDFSAKTEPHRSACFAKLLSGKTMHADFTNAKVDGVSKQVLICSADQAVMFFAKHCKGHKGIKDSPVELYSGTLIHDHDKTMYSYGEDHQECLSHVIRYLVGSIQMEPNLKWNERMLKLLRDMLRFQKSRSPDKETDKDIETVAKFKRSYDEIITLGDREYTENPPGKYYRDGYNLHKRMKEYRDAHLFFLTNTEVAPTNNEAERYARLFKRKLHQVTTFRSFDGLEYFCMNLGVLESMKNSEKNLFKSVAAVFGL